MTANVADQGLEKASEAPLSTVPCIGGCTPDMGMSLWGESPLWEDIMK